MSYRAQRWLLNAAIFIPPVALAEYADLTYNRSAWLPVGAMVYEFCILGATFWAAFRVPNLPKPQKEPAQPELPQRRII